MLQRSELVLVRQKTELLKKAVHKTRTQLLKGTPTANFVHKFIKPTIYVAGFVILPGQ